MASELKHFNVVMVVTDGHDLFGVEATVGGPASQSVAFGAAGIEDVDHREIALRIFGAQDSNAVVHAGGVQSAQGVGHAGHGAAEHGLDGIGDEGGFEGDDEIDILHILFEPAADTGVEIVEVLDDDGAFGFLVKSQNGMAAEILHGRAEAETGLAGHQVAMEGFAAEGTGYCAVGADEPEIEAKLLCDGQSEAVAASSDEDDFDAGGMGATEGGKVAFGNLELWIEQRAVDVGGQ